ncbi:MAG: carboxypeptidase-like regulatory domain-containing protein, partial [Bacteroidota bacterium]
MRLFTIIFSFTLLLSPLYAQEQARIQGSVTDVDGNPISFASVVLFSASDSSVAKTGFTTEKGQYILAPLQGGNYRLRILFAGMNTWDGDIIELAAGQQLKLETIAMKEKEATIDEVNITARKPLVEVKPCRTRPGSCVMFKPAVPVRRSSCSPGRFAPKYSSRPE